MRTKTPKTPEAIMKANLAKTLKGMKTKVADREELWLELFTDLVSTLIDSERMREKTWTEVVEQAENIAELVLDRYEARWGKG